ncbi:ABC transporter substrate-binding protein [Calidifontibacillus oryziterrae]|uniref:ABC transporter substrate-binding protein n=1 Tax=Calidifontibacillus oryziterrae TaxID=1191699 RepID=UPI0003038573|nr:ABC transporter substrate-binding protein [Calidifontibacillus oryziterrae]
MKTKWYLFFLTIITVSFILNNLASNESDSPYKIGVLMIGESRYEKYTGLREGLADLGYEEEEFSFVVKNANNDSTQLQKQVDELVNQGLDLIVTLGAIETVELKNKLETVGANSNIPVVFAGVAAPKEVGIINDYRSPSGNFTGINNYHTSLSAKRLELLRDLVPSINRVFAIYDQQIEISKLSLQNTIDAGNLLAIEVIPCDVSQENYKEILEKNVGTNDALFILPGYRIESITEDIVNFSQKHQLPVMGIYEHEVESGYMASYGTSFYDQGYQAARFVSSIIQGNSPSQLPVEPPDTLRFLVNKQVVEDYNLEINQNLIYIAEFVDTREKGENN